MSDNATFGMRLREAREKAGLSQMDLSEKCGASQTMISNWERGRFFPSLYYVIHVAQALGVRVGWLAAGEGEMV